MSNLQLRFLSSIGFVFLIIGPLFLSDRFAFTVYSVLGGLTLLELLRLLKKTGTQSNIFLAIGIYASTTAIVYQWAYDHHDQLRLSAWILGTFVTLTWLIEVFRSNKKPFESAGAAVNASIFVSASFLGILYFLKYRDDLPQPMIIIALFSLIWINDSAAYLVGRKIGKRKLYEKLSPNKTVEGSIAGLIFSTAAGVGLSFLDGMPPISIMIGFAVVCVITGSLGDLFESRLKRAAGVKDSGVFLPGHGGFLDRFDAMMLAIPSSIIYFEAILPKH